MMRAIARVPQKWSVLKVFGMLALLLLSSGCNQVESIALQSSACILVNAYGEDGRDLFPIAEALSQQRQYKSNLTHPGNPRYFVVLEGSTVGEISLKIGVGAFGARLAVWLFEDEYSELVNSEFKRFITEFERHGYELTPCEEVGYQGPARIVPLDNITSEVEPDRSDGDGAANSS